MDEQFELVKELTLESHVMHYGNLSIADEPVGWFQGPREDVLMISESSGMPRHHRISWPSRDVELLHLQNIRLLGAHSLSATVDHEIARIKEERHRIGEVFTNLVKNLVADEDERRQLFEEKGGVENLDCHDDVVRAFDSICIDINKVNWFNPIQGVTNH
ncbi:unnamed protein product [Haemonchus placei]|uniref:Uncharacterized protein n=1 Tax=Haemonchus placei TaxID=6290 RepID=A0A3P7SSW5_HAEPC|nr:unnamed protein product [Haemonchus placei]